MVLRVSCLDQQHPGTWELVPDFTRSDSLAAEPSHVYFNKLQVILMHAQGLKHKVINKKKKKLEHASKLPAACSHAAKFTLLKQSIQWFLV